MDANLLRTARADLFVVDWSPTESRYLDRWVKNGPAWPLIREVMRRRTVERRRCSVVIGGRMYNSTEIEALYRRFASRM
jgi:hypothetical protein